MMNLLGHRTDKNGLRTKPLSQFIALRHNVDLLNGDVVPIDGSRFKAVNSKTKNYTLGKLRHELGEIDKAMSAILVNWIVRMKYLSRLEQYCQRRRWNASCGN